MKKITYNASDNENQFKNIHGWIWQNIKKHRSWRLVSYKKKRVQHNTEPLFARHVAHRIKRLWRKTAIYLHAEGPQIFILIVAVVVVWVWIEYRFRLVIKWEATDVGILNCDVITDAIKVIYKWTIFRPDYADLWPWMKSIQPNICKYTTIILKKHDS